MDSWVVLQSHRPVLDVVVLERRGRDDGDCGMQALFFWLIGSLLVCSAQLRAVEQAILSRNLFVLS